MVQVTTEKRSEEEYYVKVKDLPAFADLKREVDTIVNRSSWFEKYGLDLTYTVMSVVGLAVSVWMLAAPAWSTMQISGWVLMALSYSTLTAKVGHTSAHGGLCESSRLNRFICWLSVEFVGLFSVRAGLDIHITYHHPHTNIIGLGDSSTWKIPQLPRLFYMFFAPLLFPLVTPLVGFQMLWGRWYQLFRFLVSITLGFLTFFLPLVHYCGYQPLSAFLIMMSARAAFSVPYVHVNIFQHIGLPMYSPNSRPARLYQMSSGVLNLARNNLLDHLFGHSLINCHVEHHLFPRLSDSMCLKVKPVVSKFLEKEGLPYNQDSYWNRLQIFLSNYNKLMVDAPPVWHFVGLQ